MTRLLLVLLALSLVGCMDRPTAETVSPAVATTTELPTRDEFRANWIGKTQDEVLKAFGKPIQTHDTQGSITTTWEYGELMGKQEYARDPVTGKPLRYVRFQITRDGKVTGVEFY